MWGGWVVEEIWPQGCAEFAEELRRGDAHVSPGGGVRGYRMQKSASFIEKGTRIYDRRSALGIANKRRLHHIFRLGMTDIEFFDDGPA